MCGRYTLANPKPAGFRSRFGIEESVDLSDEEPRYNIAPTDPVRASRRTEAAKRHLGRFPGAPRAGRRAERRPGPPLLTGRAGAPPGQPAFRAPLARRPCR